MISAREIRAAGQLMRPAQWPILSGQLAVGMILALGTGGLRPDQWPTLALAWVCWVILLNGGTLAFNSAYDQDTGPVAYLASPPPPPPWLARFALGMMLTGAVLGTLCISTPFGLLLLGCTILSWLYSHPRCRWKSKPGLDLVVNILGYGAGTTAAGILSGLAAISFRPTPAGKLGWIVAGFGLLFGSFYPLTQIYQHHEDTARGDRTLATALGIRRVLNVALIFGALATVAMLRGLAGGETNPGLLLVTLPLGMWLGHLVWLRWTWKNRNPEGWEKAMYRGLALWALVDAGLVVGWLIQG